MLTRTGYIEYLLRTPTNYTCTHLVNKGRRTYIVDLSVTL